MRSYYHSYCSGAKLDDKGMDIRGRNGAEALKKWHSEHPEGSRAAHGATSAHFRKRYSDLRTVEGKTLRGAIEALVSDLGGNGNLSAGQQLILSRVREKLITLALIGNWIDRQPDLLTASGDLVPVLKNSYLGYTESLRRDVEMLYSLASRRPSRTVDLESYIAGKKAAKGNGE